jgi:hypothetical protein
LFVVEDMQLEAIDLEEKGKHGENNAKYGSSGLTHLPFAELRHDDINVSVLMELQPTGAIEIALLKRISQSEVNKPGNGIKNLWPPDKTLSGTNSRGHVHQQSQV